MLNKELQNLLTQPVVVGREFMVWMGQQPWLKNDSEV
jgi:hypothetical protein